MQQLSPTKHSAVIFIVTNYLHVNKFALDHYVYMHLKYIKIPVCILKSQNYKSIACFILRTEILYKMSLSSYVQHCKNVFIKNILLNFLNTIYSHTKIHVCIKYYCALVRYVKIENV